MELKELFSEHLRELRKKHGLTQQQVSDGVSITRASWNTYENGYHMPDSEVLKRIADFFDVSTDYLLGLSDVSSRNDDVISVTNLTGITEEDIVSISKLSFKHKIALSTIISENPEEFSKQLRLFYVVREVAERLIDVYDEINKIPDLSRGRSNFSEIQCEEYYFLKLFIRFKYLTNVYENNKDKSIVTSKRDKELIWKKNKSRKSSLVYLRKLAEGEIRSIRRNDYELYNNIQKISNTEIADFVTRKAESINDIDKFFYLSYFTLILYDDQADIE